MARQLGLLVLNRWEADTGGGQATRLRIVQIGGNIDYLDDAPGVQVATKATISCSTSPTWRESSAPVETAKLEAELEKVKADKTRIEAELAEARREGKQERDQARQERDRLLGIVEASQRQLEDQRKRRWPRWLGGGS